MEFGPNGRRGGGTQPYRPTRRSQIRTRAASVTCTSCSARCSPPDAFVTHLVSEVGARRTEFATIAMTAHPNGVASGCAGACVATPRERFAWKESATGGGAAPNAAMGAAVAGPAPRAPVRAHTRLGGRPPPPGRCPAPPPRMRRSTRGAAWGEARSLGDLHAAEPPRDGGGRCGFSARGGHDGRDRWAGRLGRRAPRRAWPL